MSQQKKPELVKKFEHFLWVHTPKSWVLQTTYLQNTLFVSMLIDVPGEEHDQHQHIRRSFSEEIINSRASDLCGLAGDCVDEMRTEVKK